MPVTKEETNVAQEIIQILTGNHGEAEAYAEVGADKWLDDHGYEGVSAEAVAQAASGYGGGGGGHAGPPPPLNGGGVEAQLDYIVYNSYYEDNSITNNIENHGNLDFQQVVGDDNITQGDGGVIGQAQTGEGNVQVGGNVSDSNIEAGEGDQLVDESVNTAVGDQAQAGVGGDATQVNVEEAPEEAPPDEGEADPIL